MRSVFASLVLVFCFVGSAQADLIIVLNGDSAGRPSSTTGSGNISSIMRAAADTWESIFAPDTSIDDFTLTIDYLWGDLNGSTLGLHQLLGQADFGSIHRETSARITFDNTANPTWFADSTPLDHSEYTNYNEVTANLGGGTLKTGQYFTGATGDAAGAFDMYTVALHEIGHALGLSSANSEFIREARTEGDNTAEVTTPLPFAGSIIDLEPGSAHLLSSAYSQALMRPSIGSGLRRLASNADILANAQISQFNAVNFSAVPEPSSFAIFCLLAPLAVRRNRN